MKLAATVASFVKESLDHGNLFLYGLVLIILGVSQFSDFIIEYGPAMTLTLVAFGTMFTLFRGWVGSVFVLLGLAIWAYSVLYADQSNTWFLGTARAVGVTVWFIGAFWGQIVHKRSLTSEFKALWFGKIEEGG